MFITLKYAYIQNKCVILIGSKPQNFSLKQLNKIFLVLQSELYPYQNFKKFLIFVISLQFSDYKSLNVVEHIFKYVHTSACNVKQRQIYE